MIEKRWKLVAITILTFLVVFYLNSTPSKAAPDKGVWNAPGFNYCTVGKCDVGSDYNPSQSSSTAVYVNHYWSPDPNDPVINDVEIARAVRSASFTKSCGAEQIDVYHKGSTVGYTWIRHGPCVTPQPPIPTFTPTPSNTPTPTATFTPTATNTSPPPREDKPEPSPTPGRCPERDVRITNQIDDPASDALRIFYDELEYALWKVLNLTKYPALDDPGPNDGISLHSSIDPVQGCYQVMQHQMPGEADATNLVVTDTIGGGEMWFVTWGNDPTAGCAVEPEWALLPDEISYATIYYTNVCEGNQIWQTDWVGTFHEPMLLSGIHIDGSWDGHWLTYNDDEGYVVFYNAQTGEVTTTSLTGRPTWSVNGSILYLARDGQIFPYEFGVGELEPFEGDAIAPDPRPNAQQTHHLVEREGQLFAYVLTSEEYVLISEPDNTFWWEPELPHLDPQWWKYYLDRAQTDTSLVESAIQELAIAETVVEAPTMSEIAERSSSRQTTSLMNPSLQQSGNPLTGDPSDIFGIKDLTQGQSIPFNIGEFATSLSVREAEVVFWDYYNLAPNWFKEVADPAIDAYIMLHFWIEDNAVPVLLAELVLFLATFVTAMLVLMDITRKLLASRRR